MSISLRTREFQKMRNNFVKTNFCRFEACSFG